jgi:hypothetical protein
MSFRIRAAGVGTTGLTPGADTFRIRIGTTTLTGNIATSVAPTATASVTAQPFSFEAIVTVRTITASGTIIGECIAHDDSVTTGLFTQLNALSTTTATVAVDSTVTNLLQLTFQSGTAGSSCTFHVAEIEVLSSGAAGGSSGALVLLEQHTASSSATLDFTAFISATYDEYMIDIIDLAPANNAVNLEVEMGTGGGPTWDTGNNYEWAFAGHATGGGAPTFAGSTGIAVLANSISNNAGYGFVHGTWRATNLQSTAHRKTLQGTLQYVDSNPQSNFGMGGMQWTTLATAVTGLRFLMSAGNIASGTIRIYGIAKT